MCVIIRYLQRVFDKLFLVHGRGDKKEKEKPWSDKIVVATKVEDNRNNLLSSSRRPAVSLNTSDRLCRYKLD